MKTRLAVQALLLGMSLACCPAWAGDVVVIGNKANANTVDKALVAKLYSGETKSWPSGDGAVLYDQPEDSPVRADFSTDFVGKSPANLKAIWSRLVFSGRALPPKVVDGDAAVKQAVAANPNAIGYVRAASVDASVKVLAK
jgi:ABC-type phosphate transport system substrate-binding protein